MMMGAAGNGAKDGPSPFLAYDVRGKVGEQITEELSFGLGLSFSNLFGPGPVVVGRDIRRSSGSLSASLIDGLCAGGMDVLDIGLCGTEVVYFATSYLGARGGIMVTASHNPKDYNGMKLVRERSVPISGETGLFKLRDMIALKSARRSTVEGRSKEADVTDAYISRVASFVHDRAALSSFKVATDPGNGCAGPFLDLLAEELDLDLFRLNHDPNGDFPSGVPNPLLPEMRGPVSEAVRSSGADAGIAWDGDFDRCFLFDENGAFTEGYYIVGLLAKKMLKGRSGEKVVHDTRLVWNTREIVIENNGIPLMNRTGHAFMKDRMRAEDAIYGGEMSAHHYFRDFYHCDTGMVPWLLVLETMASEKRPLSKLLAERMERFPVSGELNRKVAEPEKALRRVEDAFRKGAVSIDHTDGVSMEHKDYRFNLRASNTEPLIRLNVETRGDPELLKETARRVLDLIDL